MKEKKLKRYTYLILPVIIFNILAQIIKKHAYYVWKRS